MQSLYRVSCALERPNYSLSSLPGILSNKTKTNTYTASMFERIERVGSLAWKCLSIEIGLDTHLEDFKRHLLSVVRPEWASKELASKTFDAGTTNALFVIFERSKGIREDAVLLRVNGHGTENIINRRDEIISILTLHVNQISPPVYAQLNNGMCYGFMNGRALGIESFKEPEIISKIIKLAVKMHSLEIPAIFTGREPQVWHKSAEWLKIAPTSFDDPEKQKRFVAKIGSLDIISAELAQMKALLADCRSPVVFCHNDLNPGNFIYNKDTDQLGVIDLEYAGPNYLAFEIADHFCEFAGVANLDFRHYPDENFRKFWIQSYLKESKGECISPQEVQELFCEVNKFTLVCHLFWIVWSLIQAKNSVIDFDYIDYAGIRFDEYKRKKDIFLA